MDDPAEAVAPDRTDAQLERHQLGRAIERAMATLPPTQRTAIVLREYHGLEIKRIARTLQLEEGTVRARLFRARRTLRKILSRGGWHT